MIIFIQMHWTQIKIFCSYALQFHCQIQLNNSTQSSSLHWGIMPSYDYIDPMVAHWYVICFSPGEDPGSNPGKERFFRIKMKNVMFELLRCSHSHEGYISAWLIPCFSFDVHSYLSIWIDSKLVCMDSSSSITDNSD